MENALLVLDKVRLVPTVSSVTFSLEITMLPSIKMRITLKFLMPIL